MFDQPCTDSLRALQTIPTGGSVRSIPEVLFSLLRGLAGLEAPNPSTRRKGSVKRYRDAEFNYLEATLPGLEGVEADICIHNGRVYVRVAR